MEGNNNNVAMFPFMAQGHFIPFISLAKMLVSQGLKVMFLTTTANTPKLKSQFNGHQLGSDIRLVSLPLPPIDGLPPGSESTDVLSTIQSQLLVCSSHKLSPFFEEWLETTQQKPLCIISDVFLCYWLPTSASRFGIPCVAFHTCGAFGASVMQYLFTNSADEVISGHETIQIRDHCMDINLRRCEVPLLLRREHPLSASPSRIVLQKTFTAAKESCAATLVNTLDAVEGGYVRYLQESTGKPVWPIASYPHLHQVHPPDSDCIRWLDSRKTRSVVYISFGTQTFLSEAQIKALALGIQASEQDFIWIIKDFPGTNINSCEFLPNGFVKATRERGMVIQGWVPQKQILSHPSVGCFVCHCGWNSTLESICAGVAMVAWPMILDMVFNARLVVDELRIGLRICEGEGFDVIPSSDEVEKVLKGMMVEEKGKEIGERAAMLKESIKGCSGEACVEAFVSHIRSTSSQ